VDLRAWAGQQVRLWVVDAFGAVLKKYLTGEVPQAPYRLDLRELPPGFYIVWIAAGEHVAQAQPLVITRG